MFELIGSITVGCLAGLITGKTMHGGGFGSWVSLLPGIVGGAVGNWMLGLLNVSWGGTIGSLGTVVVGAVSLLWIASLFRKS